MTLKRYITGFILSIVCTSAAFGIVWLHILNHHRWPTHAQIIPVIFALAVIQIIIQLVCFLDVNFKKESRDRLMVLGGAFVVVCILLSGSLWIMITLNGRMTPSPQQMEQYMNDQGGF